MGRLRVGLLRGESELSEAEKNGRLGFSSSPAGFCFSESERGGGHGCKDDRGMGRRERERHGYNKENTKRAAGVDR